MPSRRDLLLGAAGGLVLAGCGGEQSEQAPEAAKGLGGGDESVVAYALSLELFERDLYAEVVRSGRLRGEDRRLVETFREQEAAHVDALTSVLRSERAPVPDPIEADLERLVRRDRRDLLRLLVDIEDLGANAYLGAAPDILDREALAVALSIHTVEARHAAALRRRLGATPTPDGAFSAPLTPNDVRDRLGALLGSIS